MQKSIDILVKLFDRYKDVELYNGRLLEPKKKLVANLQPFTKSKDQLDAKIREYFRKYLL